MNLPTRTPRYIIIHVRLRHTSTILRLFMYLTPESVLIPTSCNVAPPIRYQMLVLKYNLSFVISSKESAGVKCNIRSSSIYYQNLARGLPNASSLLLPNSGNGAPRVSPNRWRCSPGANHHKLRHEQVYHQLVLPNCPLINFP